MEAETETKTKKCGRCLKLLHIDEFYKAGAYRQAKCKSCHNIIRGENYRKNRRQVRKTYVRTKPSMLESLPTETRNSLLELVKDGHTLAVVAQKTGVNYSTLRLWNKKNMI